MAPPEVQVPQGCPGFGKPPYPESLRIAGLDLAWGERRPDGVCVLDVRRRRAQVTALGLVQGDAEQVAWLESHLGPGPAWIAVDGPLVCPNRAGARPVDRLAHVHFGRFKCGCYPANRTLCPRPPRVASLWQARGFQVGWEGPRTLLEVYPHPALVRLFGLAERIPYKKGPVRERRRQFRRLQRELLDCLPRHFPAFERTEALDRLLGQPWTKDTEDMTDAFVCALIGYWHWLHRGRRTQVLGDPATGFLVVPDPEGVGVRGPGSAAERGKGRSP